MKKTILSVALMVLVLSVVVALGACGSKDDGESTTTPSTQAGSKLENTGAESFEDVTIPASDFGITDTTSQDKTDETTQGKTPSSGETSKPDEGNGNSQTVVTTKPVQDSNNDGPTKYTGNNFDAGWF